MGLVGMGVSSLAPPPLLPTQAEMLSSPSGLSPALSFPEQRLGSSSWCPARARQDKGDPLTPKLGGEKEGRAN